MITRAEAIHAIEKYNKESFHIQHSFTSTEQ